MVFALVFFGLPCLSAHNYQPQPVSFAEFQQRIALNADKVLVVDLWATWCKPCRERFPIVHKLQLRYSQQSIEFITLSFDDSRDPEAVLRATQFLQDQQAQYAHYIMKDPMALVFHVLELEVLPAVLLYDQNRERTKTIPATVSTQRLDQVISYTLDRWLIAEEDTK